MDRNSKKAWLYLLPALVLLGLFLIYPLVDVLIYSVEECYNFASQTYQGIGLYNYSYVLHDPYFLQAVENTFVLVIITVPTSTVLAIVIATALSSIKPLRQLFQTIYFLPYVTNTLAVGLVFMVLFQRTEYTDGLINLMLAWFGAGPIDFINGPTGPKCSCCAFTPSGWCCPLRFWCSPALWPRSTTSTTRPPGWTAPPAHGPSSALRCP